MQTHRGPGVAWKTICSTSWQLLFFCFLSRTENILQKPIRACSWQGFYWQCLCPTIVGDCCQIFLSNPHSAVPFQLVCSTPPGFETMQKALCSLFFLFANRKKTYSIALSNSRFTIVYALTFLADNLKHCTWLFTVPKHWLSNRIFLGIWNSFV